MYQRLHLPKACSVGAWFNLFAIDEQSPRARDPADERMELEREVGDERGLLVEEVHSLTLSLMGRRQAVPGVYSKLAI